MDNIHTVPGFAKGKQAPLQGRDFVKFGDFLTGIPTVPLVDAAPGYNYPMDGNDRVGDCVVAGFDHFTQIVTGLLLGTQKNYTQDQIWAFYKTQNPNFDPNGTAQTNGPGSQYDRGMNIQLFLEYLVNQKIILGFAAVDWHNQQEFQAAMYLGLALLSGVQLQNAQMQQFSTGTWDYDPTSANDGGHCIPPAGYNGTETDVITWGKVIKCTDNFIQNRMDECWFILTQAHVDHPDFRANFDLQKFSDAVKAITNGKIIIPVTPLPRTLKFGLSGPDVQDLQAKLKLLGYFPASQATTQYFGLLTQSAVRVLQKDYSLLIDGVVGPMTYAAIKQALSPITVVITRSRADTKETLGYLQVSGTRFMCNTLELPPKNNQVDVSSIPAGIYKCMWAMQQNAGRNHYLLQGVPGRDGIFIHVGDYNTDSKGCILLGTGEADLNKDGELDLLNSSDTVSRFESLMGQRSFNLIIK